MKKSILVVIASAFMLVLMSNSGCETEKQRSPTSDAGVQKIHADITVGSDGKTAEQRNIEHRYEVDNEIGAIKHLYVISAFSGQTLIYSTVDGKVTSGGKRLTSNQTLIYGDRGQSNGDFVMDNIQDDGTYGSSMNYLYWWDVKGVYHQHYVAGGQIVHVSSEAMPVTEITINLSE